MRAEARVRAHGSQLVSDQTVLTSLVPEDARSVGCPLCCRIDENHVIVEVIGSTFTWGDAPTNNAASVAAGRFTPGIVLRALTQEPLYFED